MLVLRRTRHRQDCWIWLITGSLMVLAQGVGTRPITADETRVGFVEYEVQTAFSHIRIRRLGKIRSLLFVRDDGEEAFQSQMDLARPHFLRFHYVQHMFTSYLLQPQPREVLIVGLGGGSMVRFLQKYEPECRLEVIEIDPIVIELAEKYFGLKQSENMTVRVTDALDYFDQHASQFDVIYMDAFLKPSASTDPTGAPLRLRTIEFYRKIQTRLTEGGAVVFNINPHPDARIDIETIAQAFPQVYVFTLPERQGFVVIGSMRTERMKPQAMRTAGKALDRRFNANFSFQRMAAHLTPLPVIKN